MKADRDVEALTFRPQGVVVGMMPGASLDQTRQQKDTLESEFFDAQAAKVDEEVTVDPLIAEKARRSVARMINLKN